MNGNFAGLKFPLNYSLEEMNFLDRDVTNKDDVLSSYLYTKPTKWNTLRHAEIIHPIPLKKSLPVTQLPGLKRFVPINTMNTQNAPNLSHTSFTTFYANF